VGMKGKVLSVKPIDHVGKWGQQGRSIPVGNDAIQRHIPGAGDMVEDSEKLKT
jgi:hypothetical protein